MNIHLFEYHYGLPKMEIIDYHKNIYILYFLDLIILFLNSILHRLHHFNHTMFNHISKKNLSFLL